jgi:hypothetical protein
MSRKKSLRRVSLTSAELGLVQERLLGGETPEAIARGMGISHSSLRVRLSRAGYRIAIRRELRRVTPIPLRGVAGVGDGGTAGTDA